MESRGPLEILKKLRVERLGVALAEYFQDHESSLIVSPFKDTSYIHGPLF
jgi:hypothetical protein